jgi:hypothetical protein
MRFRSAAAIASLAGALFATPAFASVTYTWNTESGGSPVTGNSSQYTFTSGESVKVRAYSLTNLTTSTFQAAGIGIYGGGLGVTYTGESTTSPNHAVDNVGKFDFLLFEFESANFSNMSFQIGWKDTDSDIQAWVGGGAAGLNLTNSGLCTGGTCNFDDLDDMGFSAPETFDNVAIDTTKNLTGSLTGRYLLLSGRLSGDYDDYFKVSVISGKESKQVPEPSSLALVAVAAVGAGVIGRKRRRVVA